MSTTKKLWVLTTSMLIAFMAIAQTTAKEAPPISDGNVVLAMYQQILHNPASMLVIALLCVVAWLADDLPFISSRYVVHITVIVGGSIFWAYASPKSVPPDFPHPMAVFVANGIICGFVAWVIHRQAIGRFISFVRTRSGNPDRSDRA